MLLLQSCCRPSRQRQALALVAALSLAAAGGAGAAAPPSGVPSAKAAMKERRIAKPRRSSLEYRLSWGLASIKADRAYAQGLDGSGVTVAMIDMGLDRPGLEMFGSVSPASTDLIRGRVVHDVSDHGRQTAALLAAALDGRGTVGVAYGAKLLSIRVDAAGSCATECFAFAGDLARGIDYALANGARVIGLPMVGPRRLHAIEPALERAVRQGVVIVTAAGNDGSAEPAWPARYAADPRFRDAIVIAGASTIAGKLATWSNKAGPLGDRYLAAPGENLLVDCGTRTCRLVSGTSYSVSYVAGALSLVMAGRTDFNAQQAASVLLRSTAELGARGTDLVAGRGLLDVSRAMKAARPDRS